MQLAAHPSATLPDRDGTVYNVHLYNTQYSMYRVHFMKYTYDEGLAGHWRHHRALGFGRVGVGRGREHVVHFRVEEKLLDGPLARPLQRLDQALDLRRRAAVRHDADAAARRRRAASAATAAATATGQHGGARDRRGHEEVGRRLLVVRRAGDADAAELLLLPQNQVWLILCEYTYNTQE